MNLEQLKQQASHSARNDASSAQGFGDQDITHALLLQPLAQQSVFDVNEWMVAKTAAIAGMLHL